MQIYIDFNDLMGVAIFVLFLIVALIVSIVSKIKTRKKGGKNE